MIRRGFVVGVVVGAALFGSASQVGAAPGIGGCGAKYSTVTVGQAVDAIDDSIYTAAEMLEFAILIAGSVDLNGDGMVCIKQYAPNPGQDKQWGGMDYVITKISDNKAQGR